MSNKTFQERKNDIGKKLLIVLLLIPIFVWFLGDVQKYGLPFIVSLLKYGIFPLIIIILFTFILEDINYGNTNKRFIFIFTYIFGFITLFAPLIIPLLLPSSEGLMKSMESSPVGLINVREINYTSPDNLQLYEKALVNSWVLNVGGTYSGGVVSGGIQIPLFVIIFSLVGGGINLLREGFKLHKSNEPNIMRERVVKSYLNVISTPFVAMVGYLLLLTFEITGNFLISIFSFSVGFKSQQIIDGILEAAERLYKGKEGGETK
jgi:hypothetical protein